MKETKKICIFKYLMSDLVCSFLFKAFDSDYCKDKDPDPVIFLDQIRNPAGLGVKMADPWLA